MTQEDIIRFRWAVFEPMRIRIMQEAYDCADRNEVEAYNSVKTMCSEVLRMAEELVLAEREACAKACDAEIARVKPIYSVTAENCAKAIRARGENE